MSLRRVLLNRYLRLVEKRRWARVEDPEDIRRAFERQARWFFHGPRSTRRERRRLTQDGRQIPALWARAPGAAEGPVLLYFHGGGYIFGSPRSHAAMLARLSALTGLPACLPDYRLAPEHRFPAAFDDCLGAYAVLAHHPGGVILGGDSAGGGLALAVLAAILRQGLPAPRGVFAFSPLTDMRFSGESFRTNAEADALLPAARAGEMAGMYLAGADPDDPRASPLRADFTGAPPVWLTVGDTEILLDDTRRMEAHLRAQGVDVTCVIEHDLPHVWPLFHDLLPEARETLGKLAAWVTSLSRS